MPDAIQPLSYANPIRGKSASVFLILGRTFVWLALLDMLRIWFDALMRTKSPYGANVYLISHSPMKTYNTTIELPELALPVIGIMLLLHGWRAKRDHRCLRYIIDGMVILGLMMLPAAIW